MDPGVQIRFSPSEPNADRGKEKPAPLRPAPPAPIRCYAAGSRHALHRRIPCRPSELQRLLPNSSRLGPPPSILWSGGRLILVVPARLCAAGCRAALRRPL